MRRRYGLTSCLVKQPLRTRLFNVSVSLVTLAGWVFASNHCALADILPKPQAQAEVSHCHASPEAPAEEGDKERECDGSKCCKSLNAPTLAFAKSFVSYDMGAWLPTDYQLFAQHLSAVQHAIDVWELDTGPPPSLSFAESVLQRSILAHAPPSLA